MIWTWKLDLLFFHVLISPFRSCSTLQELRDVLNKQLWVLVLRTMIAVGVENELRIRQVLLEDERVHRINDHVVAAINHKRRLYDPLEVGVGILSRRTPPFQRRYLGRRNLLTHFGISILLTRPESFQECPSGRLAGFGGSEKHAQPQFLRNRIFFPK